MSEDVREWPEKGLDRFVKFIEGIDGFPGAYSEFGQVYATVAFETDYEFNYSGSNSQYDLEAMLMQLLAKCRQRGAAQIVWRMRPTFEINGGKHRLCARFHTLPAVEFDEQDMKSEAEPTNGK